MLLDQHTNVLAFSASIRGAFATLLPHPTKFGELEAEDASEQLSSCPLILRRLVLAGDLHIVVWSTR
jgi:hypothetical protein